MNAAFPARARVYTSKHDTTTDDGRAQWWAEAVVDAGTDQEQVLYSTGMYDSPSGCELDAKAWLRRQRAVAKTFTPGQKVFVHYVRGNRDLYRSATFLRDLGDGMCMVRGRIHGAGEMETPHDKGDVHDRLPCR